MTPTEHLTARLDLLDKVATELVGKVTAPSLIHNLQLALRDVVEARTWMRERDFDNRPQIVQIVSAAAALAQARIDHVADVITQFGPDGEER